MNTTVWDKIPPLAAYFCRNPEQCHRERREGTSLLDTEDVPQKAETLETPKFPEITKERK